MKLKIDKCFLKGGDIIEVNWEGEDCQNLQLVVHTGQKESVLEIPASGSKKLRMKGGCLFNSLSLRGTDFEGKSRSSKRHFLVWGKQKEYDAYETVEEHPVRSRFAEWCHRMKLAWDMFSSEKKHLYEILVLLCFYLVMMNFYPILASIFMLGIICWIAWMIVRN